jgi:hypothetical protein
MTRKSKLLLISILILTVAPNWVAFGQRRTSSRKPNTATPVGWYPFTVPDGDFSLAFPAKPQPFESDIEGPVTTIRHYDLPQKTARISP